MADPSSSKAQRRSSLGAFFFSSNSSSRSTPQTHQSDRPPSSGLDSSVPAVAHQHHHRHDGLMQRKREPAKLRKRSRSRGAGGGRSLFPASAGDRDAAAAAVIAPSPLSTVMDNSVSEACLLGNNRDSVYSLAQFADHNRNSTLWESPSNGAPSLHETTIAPRARPRAKSGSKSFRSSIFGSFRSIGSLEDEQNSSRARSKASSDDDDSPFSTPMGLQALHYGMVQMTGGIWKKRSQFLVLTETHLVRFRSQSKAAEAFPAISANNFSTSTSRRMSMVSLASLQDGPVVTNGSGETVLKNIPLSNVVAVRAHDDHKTSNFSIEICYLEDKTSKLSSLQIHLTDSQDFELWLLGIRGATARLHVAGVPAFDTATVDYVVRALQQEKDYDPEVFRMYRVAQLLPNKLQSDNDPTKHSPPTACYLAIGRHKIHVVPFPKPNRSSIVSASDLELVGLCLGFMCLTSIGMNPRDDDFQMHFRIPFRSRFPVYLSSIFSAQICRVVWQRAEFLRPQWLLQPLKLNVPFQLPERTGFASCTKENYGCFQRTLVAYCACYDLDVSLIRYKIDNNCEDAPCFQLLPRAGSRNGVGYSPLELLAVLRSLRYNEQFLTISFSGVKLDVLWDLRDTHEPDHDAVKTRSGSPLYINGQENMSILSQEIRAVALKSQRLRRLDFTNSLSKDPGAEGDPGCGIPEAIYPLCRRRLTNVDWIVLNGIKLVDADLDYIVDGASVEKARLRALEISHCGLSIHDLNLVLSTFAAQKKTLESINISDVQGRLSPEVFQQQIGEFTNIRKISLSHVSAGSEPLIAPETLLDWRLEKLCLSHMTVNRSTVASIAEYLEGSRSHSLRELRLDQCGLTGRDVATFLPHMVDKNGRPRNLHLHVSENRLQVDYSLIFEAIEQNKTPTRLTMRMVEFQKEEHFRQLVEALRKNTSLKYLDISKASLPYDAGPETCKVLQLMFEENTTLEELDISGEIAHLDVVKFGIGLNLALTGLKKNNTLKVLKIEYQKLGLQGANTLASVLEENTSLVEVHCEHNELNLQSFTVLVNGLQQNKSVLYLPSMTRDRDLSLEAVRKQLEAPDGRTTTKTNRYSLLNVGALRWGINAATGGLRSASSGNHQQHKLTKAQPARSRAASFASAQALTYVNPETRVVMQALRRKWEEQVKRLERYLHRNSMIARGLPGAADDINGPVKAESSEEDEYDSDDASDGRPATAASLGTMLQQMSLHHAIATPEQVDSLPESGRQTPIMEAGAPPTGRLKRMLSFRSATSDANSRQDRTRRIDLVHELATPPPSAGDGLQLEFPHRRPPLPRSATSELRFTRDMTSGSESTLTPLPDHVRHTNTPPASIRAAHLPSSNAVSAAGSRTASLSDHRTTTPTPSSSSHRGLNFLSASRSPDKSSEQSHGGRTKLQRRRNRDDISAGDSSDSKTGGAAPKLSLDLPDLTLFDR